MIASTIHYAVWLSLEKADRNEEVRQKIKELKDTHQVIPTGNC